MLRSSSEVVFGDVAYRPGGACGPRVQKDYQLVTLLEGAARLEVDGRRLPLGVGQSRLLVPGGRERFRFDAARTSRHLWCAVSPALARSLPDQGASLGPLLVPYTERQGTLYALAFRAPRGAWALLEQLGLALLAECLAAADAAHSSREPQAVQLAIRAMERRYPEPLSVADLGREAGVTPTHLRRLFRQWRRITPGRFLWELRTERGGRLLADTGLSVAEVAYRCGFQNPYHFSRRIRERYGLSPKALRRRAWAAEGEGRISNAQAE